MRSRCSLQPRTPSLSNVTLVRRSSWVNVKRGNLFFFFLAWHFYLWEFLSANLKSEPKNRWNLYVSKQWHINSPLSNTSVAIVRVAHTVSAHELLATVSTCSCWTDFVRTHSVALSFQCFSLLLSSSLFFFSVLLVDQATDPNNVDDRWDYIQDFCQLVNQETDGSVRSINQSINQFFIYKAHLKMLNTIKGRTFQHHICFQCLRNYLWSVDIEF